MIIWFTGQPNSGKTTLALELQKRLLTSNTNIEIIDGDSLRSITNNTDYSKKGRRKNVKFAISLAINKDRINSYVIVALVSPFRDLRESLKSKYKVKEIYLHSTRIREGKMVSYYEPPLKNYLSIDTDKHSITESIELILSYVGLTLAKM